MTQNAVIGGSFKAALNRKINLGLVIIKSAAAPVIAYQLLNVIPAFLAVKETKNRSAEWNGGAVVATGVTQPEKLPTEPARL